MSMLPEFAFRRLLEGLAVTAEKACPEGDGHSSKPQIDGPRACTLADLVDGMTQRIERKGDRTQKKDHSRLYYT